MPNVEIKNVTYSFPQNRPDIMFEQFSEAILEYVQFLENQRQRNGSLNMGHKAIVDIIGATIPSLSTAEQALRVIVVALETQNAL